ncbi:MAG: M50 family metallopeptidase [Chloroflexi bacterium]|nr:M50 family metallopeptidase [Chloroflexota bacterium]
MKATPFKLFQDRRSIWWDGVFLLTAFLSVFYLWNTSELQWLIYPLRLWVTFIHEAGHAFAAILTGGELNEFVVNANGSGFVRLSGGYRLLISPAGYLGAACFGAWLFISNNRVRSVRKLAFGLGLATLIFSLLLLYFDQFAANAWQGANTHIAILVGSATGGILMAMSWLTHPILLRWLLMVLSLCCSLEAVLDILRVPNLSNVGYYQSDIYQFAEMMPIFTVRIWAYIWASIALVIFWLAVRYSYSLRLQLPNRAERKADSPSEASV